MTPDLPRPDERKLYFLPGAEPHDRMLAPPPPPPWRSFGGDSEIREEGAPPDAADRARRRQARGAGYLIGEREALMVNAALYLRRPLLVTGTPGVGKSTLAYAIAHQLRLGEVLFWPIGSRTTRVEGLYRYDAIGRLQEEARRRDHKEGATSIGDYLRLGPLGTALLGARRDKVPQPRVLLIDEIDKSDLDFPNELLDVLEEGGFEIPELARLRESADGVWVPTDDAEANRLTRVRGGRVRAMEFPIVVMTSNGERDFPPAFLRRCLRVDLPAPDEARLLDILRLRLERATLPPEVEAVVGEFLRRRAENPNVSSDQLMGYAHLLLSGIADEGLKASLLEPLVSR